MSLPPPLLLLTMLPVIAALLIMVGGPARLVARITSLGMLLITGALAFTYDVSAGGFQRTADFPISEFLGLSLGFGVDGLSIAMLLLSSIVTVAAIWVIPPIKSRENLFYACVLMISAGVVGAFASTDVLFFYAFHEMALIPTFLLIGIWGSGDRQSAAWKATIYLGLGSFVLLLGIVGLYLSLPAANRTFDLPTIQLMASRGEIHPPHWVYWTLLIGFGSLISLFPFHSWAPQAYASAPTPASMLHAGVLKKFGLYGMLRLVTPIFPDTILNSKLGLFGYEISYLNIFLILIVGNLFYIGLVTIAQKRLDWMLGYSSVMHMGYIFLGIAALNVLSLTGAAVLMVAHGLSIAALFALNGALRERTGTLEFSELGGLAKPMPRLGLLFGFAAMASVGLPGFANFPGELMVFFGAFHEGSKLPAAAMSAIQITTVFGVWGVVISAVYMLRAYRNVFFGTMPPRWASLADIAATPRFAVILLLAVLLIIGFCPQLLLNYITPSITPTIPPLP
ncbi:MAG TPA: NADH-quinone oxidoreductase subunit M [Chthoniobacterales bacterium]|nr:NADH-quinone oxidoreductase subunit M [Chthoniobacterales bacterium]